MKCIALLLDSVMLCIQLLETNSPAVLNANLQTVAEFNPGDVHGINSTLQKHTRILELTSVLYFRSKLSHGGMGTQSKSV